MAIQVGSVVEYYGIYPQCHGNIAIVKGMSVNTRLEPTAELDFIPYLGNQHNYPAPKVSRIMVEVAKLKELS